MGLSWLAGAWKILGWTMETWRVKTFGWLFLKGHLLTNSKRLQRGMTVDPTCQSCNGGVEDFDHLFKSYNLAASIWSRLLPIGMRNSFSSLDIISCFTFCLLRIFITCWKLWSAINNLIFNVIVTTDDYLFHQIRASARHTTNAFLSLKTFL